MILALSYASARTEELIVMTLKATAEMVVAEVMRPQTEREGGGRNEKSESCCLFTLPIVHWLQELASLEWENLDAFKAENNLCTPSEVM